MAFLGKWWRWQQLRSPLLLLCLLLTCVTLWRWLVTDDDVITEEDLATRVRDVEDENRLLRSQLSISQSKLAQAVQAAADGDDGEDDDVIVTDDDDGTDAKAGVEPGPHYSDGTIRNTKKCKESGEMYSSSPPSCATLAIAMVCAGHNSSRNVVTVVKSIMFYRKHPIHFHLLTDNKTREILHTVFQTWMLNQVWVSFYDLDEVVDQVSWIPNKHYSGVFGLLKLTLPTILPSSLKKVIVLDTDVILATDISKLWRQFDKMARYGPLTSLGLVENQSDWYIPGKLWRGHSPWPALGRGYNTGVILMDLVKLRTSSKWGRLWRQVAEKELITHFKTTLADQDVFNAVIKHKPDIVFNLPCQWNLQLSDNTRSSEICYESRSSSRSSSVRGQQRGRGRRDLNLIHFNSPKKLDVLNKDVEFFRNHYLTFIQFDGNLLRKDLLINCDDEGDNNATNATSSANAKQEIKEKPAQLQQSDTSNQRQPTNDEVPSETDTCHDFRQIGGTTYRTHLYFLDYEFEPAASVTGGGEDDDKAAPEVDVTLIAQLSMDRLHMVEELCDHWEGPISLALYLSDAEADQFLHFAQNSVSINSRKNIGFHIVYKEKDYYPINYLRNVALDNVKTNYVFISDIDFLPGVDTYKTLLKTLRSLEASSKKAAAGEDGGGSGSAPTTALVVAAFETQRYRLSADFPKTKAETLNLLDVGTLLTFRYHVWTKGHRATNYGKWRTATTPYQISWEQDYEPYVVLATSQAPRFDTRFVGFGWNKVSYTMELFAKGFEFWVLPSAFIIHMPHAPSLDIAKFRSSKTYRRCLKLLKRDFVDDMKTRYGISFNVSS